MCVARSLLDVHSQHMSLVRKGNILAKTTQAVRCATRTLPIPLRCSRIASPHDPASSSLLQVPGPHCALAGHCSSEPLCHVLRAQDTPSTAAVATTAAVCVSRACVCVGVAHELQPKTPRQPKAPRLAPPELPPSAEPLPAPSSKRAGKRATAVHVAQHDCGGCALRVGIQHGFRGSSLWSSSYLPTVQHSLHVDDVQRMDDLQCEHSRLFDRLPEYNGLKRPKHHFMTHLVWDVWLYYGSMGRPAATHASYSVSYSPPVTQLTYSPPVTQ